MVWGLCRQDANPFHCCRILQFRKGFLQTGEFLVDLGLKGLQRFGKCLVSRWIAVTTICRWLIGVVLLARHFAPL